MGIVQGGSYNPAALSAPSVVVQIFPPQQTLINGVPTNVLAFVGTATWGPKNAPVSIGSPQEYTQVFGSLQNRKYDMGTHAAIASLQNATNLICVRVTDGTDAFATATIVDTTTPTPVTGLTLTAKYTGTTGNNLQAIVSTGSKNGTYKITLALPNLYPEVFDNISGSGNALWVNMAAAINQGQSGIRSASNLVTATAGSSTAQPALNTYTFSGGTDGVSSITASTLIGDDTTTPRKGMYALRSSLTDICVLCDDDTSSTWSTQVTFGLQEGIYMILVDAAGQTIDQTITTKNTAGIDSYAAKLMIGDWIYWFDTVNNIPNRLVSPQPFVGGRLAALSPQYTSLNQQIYGVVGTQKSAAKQKYNLSDVTKMCANGLDAIINPPPGFVANYWATATGQNTSSNALTNDDSYTRLTNFLALTFYNALGIYIGRLNSPDVQQQFMGTLNTFLNNLKTPSAPGFPGLIKDFRVTLQQAASPYTLQCLIEVVYYFPIRNILINLQAGNTSLADTNITIQSVTPGQ